ncbi:hypothetical protein ACFBZI_11465 [Moraxella sp. ZJ142]|uniref:hypothetical protein n=1 Tax=Moraxella marmotae TaxID=3344520 RepID=UPI0035D3EF2D
MVKILGSAKQEIEESGELIAVANPQTRSLDPVTTHPVNKKQICAVLPSDVQVVIAMNDTDYRPSQGVMTEIIFGADSPCTHITHAAFEDIRKIVRALELSEDNLKELLNGKTLGVEKTLTSKLTITNNHLLLKEAGFDVSAPNPTLAESRAEADAARIAASQAARDYDSQANDALSHGF